MEFYWADFHTFGGGSDFTAELLHKQEQQSVPMRG
jgi:hypothetical protein